MTYNITKHYLFVSSIRSSKLAQLSHKLFFSTNEHLAMEDRKNDTYWHLFILRGRILILYGKIILAFHFWYYDIPYYNSLFRFFLKFYFQDFSCFNTLKFSISPNFLTWRLRVENPPSFLNKKSNTKFKGENQSWWIMISSGGLAQWCSLCFQLYKIREPKNFMLRTYRKGKFRNFIYTNMFLYSKHYAIFCRINPNFCTSFAIWLKK